MEIILLFINIILHLDTYLQVIVQQFGLLTYGILFLVIFCETGLVVTPFLPGDSLLFVIGTLSAGKILDLKTIWLLLIAASILGDTINYQIGKFVGPKIFQSTKSRFLNKKYLDKTHAFYEKHGGKTIILAKFMPIIRTFAPFVAGIGAMTYLKFLCYNVTAAIIWISLLILSGYFFGNLPIVSENLSLVIILIILISIMPGIITYLKNRN